MKNIHPKASPVWLFYQQEQDSEDGLLAASLSEDSQHFVKFNPTSLALVIYKRAGQFVTLHLFWFSVALETQKQEGGSTSTLLQRRNNNLSASFTDEQIFAGRVFLYKLSPTETRVTVWFSFLTGHANWKGVTWYGGQNYTCYSRECFLLKIIECFFPWNLSTYFNCFTRLYL